MTREQESILEQIIEAFQNGKSLSDLPLATDVDPYTLIFEVLDGNESKKASLSSILPYLKTVISEVVAELPEASEQTTGKLYLVPTSDAKVCNAYITELENDSYGWKQIGQKAIIYGFLNNGTFYLTKNGSTYSEPVTPQEHTLYVDLEAQIPYIWDSLQYKAIGGKSHPYVSLERLRAFLYKVTFDSLPQDNGGDNPVGGGCSSYVRNGKLYRNLDFNYNNAAEFIVRTKDFEGMSFVPGLNDGALSDDLIGQLPYRVNDGQNNYGISVATHILFNDWSWAGCGEKSVPLTRLPYLVLTRVKSMATIAQDLAGVLDNLAPTAALVAQEYLLQLIVTDGTTTYAIMPPTADNQAYVLQDISSNPKLANFRWVSSANVVRADLQTRPTGVERWNAMPCPLADLRFTKAYESNARLSEFIGIDETTKSSTDAELQAIYNQARSAYLERTRDGQTWQTMHSVVYGNGMESLFIQENWNDKCVSRGIPEGVVRYDQPQALSGVEQAQALANLGISIEDIMMYGIEFDTSVSSPACTRIGNADLHRALPIQNLMRGCLLDDSGQVVEYLPDNDWTTATRDGSRGQVMVEIPAHYRKFETQGTKRRVKISQSALPGYHLVPKQYVSAYEATVQRSVNKLASVVNNTADYRGGNNSSSWDELAKSLLGRPASSISRTNFRTYARNRGAVGKNNCGWNCMTYDIQKELYWLFVIEYATLNSQAAYNAQLTSEGYRQGGLGDGVSTWSDSAWSAFNSYNPFVPCGHTDSLGNKTGVVQYDVKNDEQAVIKSFSVPRYRGVENPFAHIWQWTDGINVQIRPNADEEPKSKVYVCSDPSKFNDSNYDGYTYVGDEARSEGYVKSLIFGEGGEIMPDAVGGGSTTYFCDYHYTNIPSAVTLRGVSFGGNANYGATGGFVCAYSNHAPSSTSARIGSRLCFIPA